MKLNGSNSHLLLKTNEIVQVKIGTVLQDISKFEHLLGVTIDNKLKFNEPMRSTCIKAGATLNA